MHAAWQREEGFGTGGIAMLADRCVSNWPKQLSDQLPAIQLSKIESSEAHSWTLELVLLVLVPAQLPPQLWNGQ